MKSVINTLTLSLFVFSPVLASAVTTNSSCKENYLERISSKVSIADSACSKAQKNSDSMPAALESAKAALTTKYSDLISSATSDRRKQALEKSKLRALESLEKRYNGTYGLVARAKKFAVTACKKFNDAADSLSKLSASCSKDSGRPSTSPVTPTPAPVTTVSPAAVPSGTAGTTLPKTNGAVATTVLIPPSSPSNNSCAGNCAPASNPVTVSNASICNYAGGSVATNYPCYEISGKGYTLRINQQSGSANSPTSGAAPTGNFLLPNGSVLVSIANIGFTPVDGTQDFGSFYNPSRFNVADTTTYVTYNNNGETVTKREVDLPNYAPALCQEENAKAIGSSSSGDPCSQRSSSDRSVCLGYWDTAKCS